LKTTALVLGQKFLSVIPAKSERVKAGLGFSVTLKTKALRAAHGSKAHAEKLFPHALLIRV